MLAIPIDSKGSTTISKFFGNAPFFAMLDLQSGEFYVIENQKCKDGKETATHLANHHTTSTIFYHMGEGVYEALIKNEIQVFTANKKCLSIDEIYTYSLQGTFTKLDDSNYMCLLDSGTTACNCAKG